jgi:hypothetical protein
MLKNFQIRDDQIIVYENIPQSKKFQNLKYLFVSHISDKRILNLYKDKRATNHCMKQKTHK